MSTISSRKPPNQQQLLQQLGQPKPALKDQMHGDARAELIPCPAIKTLVREGLITPDKDGRVDVTQLKDAFRTLGISRSLTAVLGHGGTGAIEGDRKSATLNLFKLMGSKLDHKGSMVHEPGKAFDKAIFDTFVSFSSDGVSLSINDIAQAQLHRAKAEGASTKDKFIGTLEAGLLISVIGTENAKGEKSVKLKDFEAFMKENVLPADWKPAQSAGITDVVWTAAKDVFAMLTGTSGRADHGLRMALGEEAPLNQSSLPGLTALCPVGGKPAAGKGTSAEEVAVLHASLVPPPEGDAASL